LVIMIDIGSRLELFVDDYLIDQMEGVSLNLHHPTPKEVVIHLDQPWEGNISGYVTVFWDGDIYRMYYRGAHFDWDTWKVTHKVTCYAESQDRINWTRPELGLFECGYGASKSLYGRVGQTSTVWLGDTQEEYVCEEMGDELILIKNREGRVIEKLKVAFEEVA